MFELSAWKAAVWIVATFGIAGLIAFIIFAPVLARACIDIVVRCCAFVFRYRLGCALVAALLAILVTDYVRRSIEDKRHAAQRAAFEQAQTDRDKRIAREVREEVWKEIADATAENAVIDKEVKEFTDALPSPTAATGNLFAVGSESCRLRHIAGQAGCGSNGSKRVP